MRTLCQLYSLADPLAFLQETAWKKVNWKTFVNTKIVAQHESEMRKKALTNWKLRFLNIQMTGLSGRPHPILSGVLTSHEAVKSRAHVKMLAGDYLCYATLAIERGSDPQCRLCPSTTGRPAPSEDIIHILTRCRGTEDTRWRMVPELLNTVAKFFPSNAILSQHDHQVLTQFILDCSSPNLPTSTRIDPNHLNLN